MGAISHLGEGDEPSPGVMEGCQEFLCQLFCPTSLNITHAKDLRWHIFKQLKVDQGVGKLPPTPGAWEEHIKCVHIQASI